MGHLFNAGVRLLAKKGTDGRKALYDDWKFKVAPKMTDVPDLRNGMNER